MFTVLMRPEAAVSRDEWIEALREKGIESRPVFYPIHTMPMYAHRAGFYPVAEQCAALGINLPTHGNLTRDDVGYVCEQAVATWKSLRNRKLQPHARAA
jgi:perosamine synthetase